MVKINLSFSTTLSGSIGPMVLILEVSLPSLWELAHPKMSCTDSASLLEETSEIKP